MGLIVGGPGQPLTVSSASGGKVTAVNNLGTAPLSVIGANPARQKITFHNPGTVNLYVFCRVDVNGNLQTCSLASLGGSYVIFPGAVFELTGECQRSYSAFAASGVNNPLTITESNL